jgi:hypothetical protein
MSRDEMCVARAFIQCCLDAGWMVSLFDGEEWAVRGERDYLKIVDQLGATCEEQIVLRDPSTKVKVGWVLLVWGNSPSELIADHTLANEELVGIITECEALGISLEESRTNV